MSEKLPPSATVTETYATQYDALLASYGILAEPMTAEVWQCRELTCKRWFIMPDGKKAPFCPPCRAEKLKRRP